MEATLTVPGFMIHQAPAFILRTKLQGSTESPGFLIAHLEKLGKVGIYTYGHQQKNTLKEEDKSYLGSHA